MNRKAPELPAGLWAPRGLWGGRTAPRGGPVPLKQRARGLPLHKHRPQGASRTSGPAALHGGCDHGGQRPKPHGPSSRKPLRHNERAIPFIPWTGPHSRGETASVSHRAKRPLQASTRESLYDRRPPSRGGARTPRDQACTDGQVETHGTRFLGQGSARPQTTPSGQKRRWD